MGFRINNRKTIIRERMNQRLEKAFESPLSVVVAPMGYGKSIAIEDYLCYSKINYAWIPMYHPINIEATKYFFYQISQALKLRFPSYAAQFNSLSFPDSSKEILVLIQQIRQMVREPFAIVIDDYHAIENDAINSLLERIVHENIEDFHIVLVSRKLPKMCISELCIKGLCESLLLDEIKFTKDEMNQYFDTVAFDESEEIRSKIYSHVNGWISAAYIMITHYKVDKALEMRSLNEIIRISFFDDYSQDTKKLLLQFSLLEYMNIDQLNFVLDGENPAALLDNLRAENAFIAKDSQGVYRFHDMYRQFLDGIRREYPINTQEIYDRNAQWLRDNGLLMQALIQWKTRDNIERILEEVERWDLSNFTSNDRELLYQILDNIPLDKLYQYPMVTLKHIFWIILSVDRVRGKQMLADFQAFIEENGSRKYSVGRIKGEINIISTAIAFGDAEAMSIYMRNAKEHLGNDHSYIRTKNNSMTDGCPHFTFYYLHKPGSYKKIADIMSTNYSVHTQVTAGCGAGGEYLANAEYSLETGVFSGFEREAKKAIIMAERYQQDCIKVCALMALGRFYIMLQDIPKQQEVLADLKQMRESKQTPITMNVIENGLGYLYACMNERDHIPSWLRDGDMTQYKSLYKGATINYIIHVKSLLLADDLINVDVLCDDYLGIYEKYDCLLGQIHMLIFKAIAQLRLRGNQAARKPLLTALTLAQPDNIVMPFIDNLSSLSTLLQHKYAEINAGFLSRIKNATSFLDRGEETSSSLTKREEEIMLLLKGGDARKDIAEKLYISQNTVKRHIQNIYKKLGAKNRVIAMKKYDDASSRD